MAAPRFDEIGYWSEVKLEIVKKYAAAYSTILAAGNLSHVYIDGFAGRGVHLAKSTGQFVPGSPLNALLIEPPFKEYFFVDLDGDKIGHLKEIVGDDQRVKVKCGDCNQVLLDEVFPSVRYQDYRRGLCLLDPYGLHLNWEVLQAAGELKTIDLFLNFPVMDMNMNALWNRPEAVSDQGVTRMTAFWGDESWREAAYVSQPTLFGEELVKQDNHAVAEAFRDRLRDMGSFEHVPDPMPMRNSRSAVVYYLFFASQKPVASRIVKDIFSKYGQRRS